VGKLSKAYRERPANPVEILRLNKEKFQESPDIDRKAKLVNEILNLLRCDNSNKADLLFIGGKGLAGNMTMGKKVICDKKIYITNQSITGLFENRIEI